MANGAMRAEKGTDRLWYYLSANEFLPVLRATLEERVWRYKGEVDGVLSAIKMEGGTAPKVGGQKWLDNVVRKVMTHAWS